MSQTRLQHLDVLLLSDGEQQVPKHRFCEPPSGILVLLENVATTHAPMSLSSDHGEAWDCSRLQQADVCAFHNHEQQGFTPAPVNWLSVPGEHRPGRRCRSVQHQSQHWIMLSMLLSWHPV